MKNSHSKDLAIAARRIAAWRRHRSSPRSRMPEELWELAVELARLHTPTEVGRRLRLDPHRIKTRMHCAKPKSPSPAKRSRGEPKVVRLAPLIVTPPPEVAGAGGPIEIENQVDERLRLDPAPLQSTLALSYAPS